MGGVKGNDGKATKNKLLHQFAVILAAAAMLVGGIMMFGTAPWHSKAVPHEGQLIDSNPQKQVEISREESKSFEGIVEPDVGNIAARADGETNFIQFEFSNLDGEEGSTGNVVVELLPEWAPLGVKRIKVRLNALLANDFFNSLCFII
jgi:hypothetical protein